MEIVEAPVFTKRIVDILSDDEYRELQWALIANPTTGVVIPGGRGLRKLRWAIPGKGKSGGLRIIYYLVTKDDKIYLILPFRKSDQEDLTKAQLQILSSYINEGVL